MKIKLFLPIVLLSLALAACHEDEFEAPAFLHVDGITTYIPSTGAFSTDSGFYRSDIVAAYVVAYYPNVNHVDTLGLYRLPFTIPVLHSGPIDHLYLYPAVEQSGISGALPFYTFYNPIHHTGLSFQSGDTLNLGIDSTTYNPLTDSIQLFEPFELPSDHVRFLSPLTWVQRDPDGACTGRGYGKLHVADSQSVLTFAAEDLFYVPDPSKILYLELDIRNDIPLQVYMQSSYYDNTSTDLLPVMVVNPSSRWRHLYINLGRTWAYFSHHSTFRLQFSAVNQDAIDGDICIDNVKLLTTSVSL